MSNDPYLTEYYRATSVSLVWARQVDRNLTVIIGLRILVAVLTANLGVGNLLHGSQVFGIFWLVLLAPWIWLIYDTWSERARNRRFIAAQEKVLK